MSSGKVRNIVKLHKKDKLVIQHSRYEGRMCRSLVKIQNRGISNQRKISCIKTEEWSWTQGQQSLTTPQCCCFESELKVGSLTPSHIRCCRVWLGFSKLLKDTNPYHRRSEKGRRKNLIRLHFVRNRIITPIDRWLYFPLCFPVLPPLHALIGVDAVFLLLCPGFQCCSYYTAALHQPH